MPPAYWQRPSTTNFAIPRAHYRFTAGTPKTYATKLDGGMRLTYSFYDSCGTTVWKAGDAEAFKDIVLVQAGTLDDIKEIETEDQEAELYVSRRVPWLPAWAGQGLDVGVHLSQLLVASLVGLQARISRWISSLGLPPESPLGRPRAKSVSLVLMFHQ